MLNGIYPSTSTMAAFGMTLVKTSLQAVVCIYLLMLFCPVIQSRGCRRVYNRQKHMNKEILKLLEKMDDTSLNKCTQAHPDFQRPFRNNTSRVKKASLRGIVSHTVKMFKSDLSKVTTKGNVHDVEKLQTLLKELLNSWTDCFTVSEGFKKRKKPKKDVKIKSYFQRMMDYLKSEGYSACAWATARSEVQKSIRFVARSMDILTKRHLN